MLDLQELKRLAEAVGTHNAWTLERVERLKEFRELATAAAILSLIAEVESLRRQLEEVTSSRDAFKSLYEKTLDDIGAVLVSKDADIERAVRMALKFRDNWPSSHITPKNIVAAVFTEMKEQGK